MTNERENGGGDPPPPRERVFTTLGGIISNEDKKSICNYVGVTDFDALGLFDGIIIPHCGCLEYRPELREELYNKLISENKYNVYKLTNDESLLVNDGNVRRM